MLYGALKVKGIMESNQSLKKEIQFAYGDDLIDCLLGGHVPYTAFGFFLV